MPRRYWGGGGVIAPPFLTSAPDGDECLASRRCCFTPRKGATGIRLHKGPDGPQSQVGLCGEEKNVTLPGIEPVLSSPTLDSLSYASSPRTRVSSK
jgi:hypothetical protein